jgi:hypothetical protein
MSEPQETTDFDRVWDETTYVAETPAGHVRLTMRGDSDLSVWIDATWFDRAGRAGIEAELARAGKLLYVTRTRAYYDTSSRVAGMEIRPVTDYVSEEQRRYFEGLEQLHAQGASADGRVSVTMVGLSHFAVSLGADALSVDSASFAASCREAAMACFRDHTEAWQRLHFDVYVRPRMQRAGLL